jgi:Ca2+/Na+ antiporter
VGVVNQGKTQSIGPIVGGVLAGICVVFILAGIIITVKCAQKRKQKSFRYDGDIKVANCK